MGKFSRKDYISGLPQSIIEIILTKLPTRDALRTSILSKKWRYQWTTMTQLVFDDKCVSRSDGRQVTEKKLVDFIVQFLLLHNDPIYKFTLSTMYFIRSSDINPWLLFLSRKDIKRLVLNMCRCGIESLFLRTPSCIFSCQKLIKLKLLGFEVKPSFGFQGFPCLKNLTLFHCLVTSEAIEILVSGCPLLEKFKLITSSDLALTVRAPNLKHLTLEGGFRDVYLAHTPLLVKLSISFSQSVGNVLLKVPATYDCLKFISLEGINFQEMNEVLYVLRLLLQSPNLQELKIYAGAVEHVDYQELDLDIWKRECPADFTFKHLKSFDMAYLSNRYDLEFIEFVLRHSPVLEVMSISPYEDYNGNMADKVLHLFRASPKVEIRFFD